MSQYDMEFDVYCKTEQWTIVRGLPGQRCNDLRSLENGEMVVDEQKVHKFIKEEYPWTTSDQDEPDQDESCLEGLDSNGNYVMSNGTVQLPQEGDVIPGDPITKPSPARKIPRSVWKCDG